MYLPKVFCQNKSDRFFVSNIGLRLARFGFNTSAAGFDEVGRAASSLMSSECRVAVTNSRSVSARNRERVAFRIRSKKKIEAYRARVNAEYYSGELLYCIAVVTQLISHKRFEL